MQTQDLIKLLDEAITTLNSTPKPTTADPTPRPAITTAASTDTPPLADAIDRELSSPPRQTSITSLRDSAALDQFRQELETESLSLTTITSLLQLLRQALQAFGVIAA